jgi:hypothetical protein
MEMTLPSKLRKKNTMRMNLLPLTETTELKKLLIRKNLVIML